MSDERDEEGASNLSLRLAFLGIVVIGLFAALFARIWFLQVLATEEYQVQADTNQVRLVNVPPQRGRILDRNGVVLADNEFSGVVRVNPSQFAAGDREIVLTELERLTGETQADLAERMDDPAAAPFSDRTVAFGLDEDLLELVVERSLPGVTASWEARRVYPEGSLAAHVVGYVGAQPADWIDDNPGEGYLPNDRIGRAGIEGLFESTLRGEAGVQKVEVDRQNRVVRELGGTDPVPGADVYLTLDLELQQAVEFYLVEGLREAQGRESSDDPRFLLPAYAGAVVVMDVRNGDVLAMASYPTYKPEWLTDGISRAQYDATFNDPSRPGPLNNRAVQGLYAPGSVFKLISAVAATRTEVITPRGQFVDTGTYTVPVPGGGTFQNAGGVALGPVDLGVAITKSSDTYFYSAAFEMYELGTGNGRFELQQAARDFGFGAQTGVQLPFERAGTVPTPEIKRAIFEAIPEYQNQDNTLIWVPGDTINLAIGQGFLNVTPLQLVNSYAAWANGGTVFQPNIADRVVSRDSENAGEVIRDFGPAIVNTIDFSGVPVDVITEGLEGVTLTRLSNAFGGQISGTAATAFDGWDHRGWGVVGKTGTSESEGINKVLGRSKEDNAIFVGYGPRHDPRYAVVVVMEEAGFGGEAAAPVARNVFAALRAFEQDWPEPEDLPLEPAEGEISGCPELPITILQDPTIDLLVPEGCPYGEPIPIVGDDSPDDVALPARPVERRALRRRPAPRNRPTADPPWPGEGPWPHREPHAASAASEKASRRR